MCAELAREQLMVRGLVQGVGFRPYVYRLASALHLSGSVCNRADSVVIDIQGDAAERQAFLAGLRASSCPGVIDAIDTQYLPVTTSQSFHIADSPENAACSVQLPDLATCDTCLQELFDPGNRRYRYPFISCAQCGPRATILRQQPYDRARTSMAAFQPCAICAAEYQHPEDRRFHAQTNACPQCGPTWWTVRTDSTTALATHHACAADSDPARTLYNAIAAGERVAIRGVGGFHLACDATQPHAVAALRTAKQRPTQPLAVMVSSVDVARRWVQVSDAQAHQLRSVQRPIVLLERRADAPAWLDQITPGLDEVGVMLPPTALYDVLLDTALQLSGQPPVWVVTSANQRGHPILADNHAALHNLADLATVILLHDRAIVTPLDDSVVRMNNNGLHLLRRARGYAPGALSMPAASAPVVAMGADQKNTFCVALNQQVLVSAHLGKLGARASRLRYQHTLQQALDALPEPPRLIVHDRHPDFFTTQLAIELGERYRCPTLATQHHHAHLAAVVAEHQVPGAVLGLALDGFGLGLNAELWGGELLYLQGTQWQRLGHLARLALPGADLAAREPWRVAAGVLHRLRRGQEITTRFAAQPGAFGLQTALQAGVQFPLTSSAGRWFDAAAALLGVVQCNHYDSEAALRLESLAYRHAHLATHLADGYQIRADGQLDLLPCLAILADGMSAEEGAARFHATLIVGLTEWCANAAHRHGLSSVVLSGGCLHNRVLLNGLQHGLRQQGLQVYSPQRVPCGDGGLSLGQAWLGVQSLHQAAALKEPPLCA